jgi:pimeloyl-ACP methyl ester carboxylesterase
MTPLFFGSSQRRLYGAYDPPQGARPGARAVVLCYPWGQEYLRAHRSMRRLANMLAAVGCHVLRFDYFGTGDSMGTAQDVTRRGWEQDIETAIEELQDTSGATQVSLVGLRLGATLAAHVAVRKKKLVHTLVLWDPVVSGLEYLEELLGGDTQAMGSGGGDVQGFPMTDSFAAEIRELDVVVLVPELPARTRFIQTAPLPSHATLRAALDSAARSEIPLESVDALPPWVQDRDYGAGAVPTKVLETIVQWVR